MAKIWVYSELSGGRPASAALELLTKARELGDVEAIALGPGARDAAPAMKVKAYEAPPVRKAGAKVASVDELVKRLSEDAKVL